MGAFEAGSSAMGSCEDEPLGWFEVETLCSSETPTPPVGSIAR